MAPNRKMDVELKAEWVKRLRSGEIKQGKNVLHRVEDGTQCCLGVLCEIAFERGVVDRRIKSRNGSVSDGLVYNYGPKGTEPDNGVYSLPDTTWSDLRLPPVVTEWARVDPRGVHNLSEPSLANMNDNGGTFVEIAEVIEWEF